MGGSAFLSASAEGHPTLHTPRMTPDVYAARKTQYTAALQSYFPECHVVALKEAPEKSDYGDVDFMVCTDRSLDLKNLATFLGAAGVIDGGPGRCSIAVPQDGSKSCHPPVTYKAAGGPGRKGKPSTDKNYAQIDIELVHPSMFKWYSFFASYGDLAGLLGAIMHNIGFTVSDRGLFLRFEELDEAKQMQGIRVSKEECLLLLSNEPEEVMRFLGVSPEKYEAGFATIDAFYTWLAESRLVTADFHIQSKRKNTSKQRQKDRKRPMIGNFFDEFLPAYLNLDTHHDSTNTTAEDAVPWSSPAMKKLREKYAEEALQFFDKSDAYEIQHNTLVGWLRSQKAEQLIKPIVAEVSGKKERKLAEVVRAFRRRVRFGADEKPYIAEVAHSDQESELRRWLDSADSLKDVEAVRAWIEAHWEELKELERREEIHPSQGPDMKSKDKWLRE
ncbi:uncharacterized protein MYCFIDRAFT_78675 [Pseudocercospora fijiensis CIRAD86]|uniref:Uncharacterized protein n=1 Tax=Pseudocercospora fijiensis (strain CIRAD86) TaxID=383855 RepID=M3ABD6_PSEFD|nr:uncharacterized protein MYCFIDRAFT_78675 [Pseudocercospora fijiensis CIRAD86]EME81896.1 hypothetical protein MYCFIDRAFT_78675 [Pseudocercospora fijiensis CIRAD86]